MDLIDSFSTTMQAIIVVLVFSGLTVAGLYFVRRHVSSRQLKEDHDVAGFTFSVVGAFYGMILAFVIVAVWQRFERANEQAGGNQEQVRWYRQASLPAEHGNEEYPVSVRGKKLNHLLHKLFSGPQQRCTEHSVPLSVMLPLISQASLSRHARQGPFGMTVTTEANHSVDDCSRTSTGAFGITP